MSKEAKPDRWMPLFIGDYKKDTGRLTRDQHGGYLLLIMEYWNTGPLQDDDEELAAIALADAKEWRKLRPKLERFFTVADGLWRHKRVDAELDRWSERKAKAVERATEAANARWGGGSNDKPPNRPKRNAPSNAPSIAPSTRQALLEQCPQSPPREVDAHKGQSTLSGRERPEARLDGASGLRVIAGAAKADDQAAWLHDLTQASRDYEHFERTDPQFASEIAEFIAHAEVNIRRIAGRAV